MKWRQDQPRGLLSWQSRTVWPETVPPNSSSAPAPLTAPSVLREPSTISERAVTPEHSLQPPQMAVVAEPMSLIEARVEPVAATISVGARKPRTIAQGRDGLICRRQRNRVIDRVGGRRA